MAAVLVGEHVLWPSSARLTITTGHPFDLTKTRLQTAAPGAYKGAIDVVKQTLARDGVTGCVLSFLLPRLGAESQSLAGCIAEWSRHY